MTTLSSAVRNVWEFTVDNIGLVLYLLETLLSAVFVSGFTVFSFIIDLVNILIRFFLQYFTCTFFHRVQFFLDNFFDSPILPIEFKFGRV